MVTTVDTARLLALLEAATPRPWVPCIHGHIMAIGSTTNVASTWTTPDENYPEGRPWKANAELIAEAVNALPGLLAENERLRAALAWRPLEDASLNDVVLLQLDDLDSPVVFAWKDTDGWYTEEGDKVHFPLCWMPKPEPREALNAKG